MSGDLAARAAADGVTFLLAVFVDLAGKSCAKLVPIEAADELESDGVGFAGYAVGAMGQQPRTPTSSRCRTSPSYTPLPQVREPGLAIVHCDPHVDGEPWPYAPRVILKAALEQAADLELQVRARRSSTSSSHRDADGRLVPPTSATPPPSPATTPAALTRMYDHLTEVSTAMNAPRLGQLRQRPRGRQRPVRAELHLRRRPHHRRPGHHGCGTCSRCSPSARHDGHVHAQAVHRPHRQRDAPAPVAVARRLGAVPRSTTSRAGSPARLRVRRRACSTTRAGCRP